jgi:hypothetical protein
MTERPEFPKIRAVRARPHSRIEVQWDFGPTMLIDMREAVASGGVFEALKDQDLFATVQLGDRGRSIEWRDPTSPTVILADYCADALLELADRQRAISSFNRLVREVRDRFTHSAQPNS